VNLLWRFRWLRFAPPPANFHRASGAEGVCQRYPKLPHSKGSATPLYAQASYILI
jgi:hypothetical protein